MTARYDIRRRALTDLDDIRDYTRETWGASQTRGYIAELRRSFVTAAAHPARYPLIKGRTDGLRRIRSGSHIVIFAASSERVEIVRILHERMDIDTQLDG
jgi:toxin ParE1/3/4